MSTVRYLLFALFLLLSVSSTLNKSFTMDEFDSIFSGYRIVHCGDFAYRQVNPPLARLLTATPWLLKTSRDCPTDPHEHKRQFVEEYQGEIETLHFLSKCLVILISLICAQYVFLFAKELYNERAALGALFLFVSHPVFLANARLATTDMLFAAVNIFCLYHLLRWLKTESNFHFVLSIVFTGLAIGTKFSAIALLLALLPALIIKRASFSQWAIVAIVPLGIVNVLYGFSGSFLPLGELEGLGSALLQSFQQMLPASLPLPLPKHFLSGLDLQMVFNRQSFPQYLNGSWYGTPKAYYYAFVLLYKTPLLLLLFAAGAWRERSRAITLTVFVPILLYFVLMSFFSLNIGIRYILPAVVLMVLPAGYALSLLRAFAAVPISILLAQNIAVYPHYLTFFTPVLGGPAQQHAYLLDSNLDWGQDLPLLQKFLRERKIPKVYLAYFGNIDPAIYDIEIVDSPTETGYAVISANLLFGHTIFLKDYELSRPPFEQIAYIKKFGELETILGHTLYVYRMKK